MQKAEEARLAAEKERLQKAEEARLAAEKERLQKAEKLRLKKIVQENYRLYSTVKNKKKRIDSLRYDRGETFGTYLDSLQDNFSAAELAWNMNEPYKKDPESANRFYKEADRAADWIIVNAPLRSEAQSLQKRVIEQKALADRFDAQKYSLRSYQQAEEYAALADKNYESGNFSPAVKSLQSALAGYRNAYITSRKSFLNECLKSARIALDRKQWDKVKVMAEKIRVINKVQADELMKSLNQQMEIEKLNQKLAAAKKAKAEQKWLDVYKFALEALAMDGTCREAKTLKNESEKFCLNEKCAELFLAGKFKEAWNVLEKIPKRSAQTERILGCFYSYGLNLSPVNKKMAFEHYRKSAEMGDLIGKSEYACCLYRGTGCSRDVERAEQISREIYAPLRKMAESGNLEAQNNLGVMYHSGEGVAKNFREAVKWLRRSAEQGSIFAAMNLGTCYYLGTGVKKDYNEAVKQFRKGAELGCVFSQVWLGTCYKEGNGVGKDLSAALSWYRRGAEQGDPQAQMSLGFCYFMGTGVKKDYYEAIKWYRRAAEQEWGNAYSALGYCYYNGLGMKKDYDAAFRLFKKGAEKNEVDSFIGLGMCYEYGKGVYFKDRTKAAEWYRKAAEAGSEFAKESLQRLGY